MSKSVTGGFGDKALRKIIAKDSFVQGMLKGLYISKTVNYYSGSVGSGVRHTGDLEIVKRRKQRDGSRVRIVSASPNVFLKVYIPSVSEYYLVDVPCSKLVDFGEFSSLHGNFNLTIEEVPVKFDSENITFKNIGRFPLAKETDETIPYTRWTHTKHNYGEGRYVKKCGEKIEKQLKKEWAKKQNIREALWTVSDVDDSDHTTRVTLTVTKEGVGEELSFTFSTDDWDENESIRRLVEKDGHGLVSNLEGEQVFVSLDELSATPVAEERDWYLYRAADKPNIITQLFRSYLP